MHTSLFTGMVSIVPIIFIVVVSVLALQYLSKIANALEKIANK